MSLPCPLLKPNGCGWCGRKLKGRQTRWCSRTCAREFTANHRFTQAKAAVKKPITWYLCANANENGNGHAYGPEGCEGFTQKIEINHIEPCIGKQGVWGCHHHLDNLEGLCKPCHLAATATQRKEGKF